MKRLLIILVVIFASSLLFAEDEEKRIVTKGIAIGELPDVRDEALKDALRKAVEQGVGVVVTAQSEVRDYQLAFEQIVTEATGYVKSYTIRSEGYEGEKRYYVEVDAVVSLADIKDDWGALKMILQQKGNPSFLVSVVDKVDGELEKGSTVGQTEITGFMLSKDIQMVNKKVAEEAIQKEMEAARIAGDRDKLINFAKKYAADIVLIGSVEAVFKRTANMHGRSFNWYSAVLEVQAVRADDGTVIAAPTETIDLGPEGCAEGKREAAMKALKGGAAKAAERVLSDIIKKWQKELLTGAPMTIEVKNVTYTKAEQITESLKKIRFTTVYSDKMEFSSNMATIPLKTPFLPKKFLSKMIALKIVKDSEVSEVGKSKITIELKQE